MENVIRVLGSGVKLGVVGLGFGSQSQAGSIKSQVLDGDTVSSHPFGDLGVRFLGVDAPEKTFPLGDEVTFRRLDSEQWQQFMAHALEQTFEPAMTPALKEHLTFRVNAAAAVNHRAHALDAERALVDEIQGDLDALGQTLDAFRFVAFFAHDVMDGFGRLLCYLNRDQSSLPENAPRPDFYQERLLASGRVAPFFIWPNVDPFIHTQARAIKDAVFAPGGLGALDGARLQRSRDAVREARDDGRGIFNPAAPLSLQPFEIRFLARGRLPLRWVIDLGAPDSDQLIRPQNYFTIPNLEDRLYIPEEYVPLFEERGWKKQAEVVFAGIG